MKQAKAKILISIAFLFFAWAVTVDAKTAREQIEKLMKEFTKDEQ